MKGEIIALRISLVFQAIYLTAMFALNVNSVNATHRVYWPLLAPFILGILVIGVTAGFYRHERKRQELAQIHDGRWVILDGVDRFHPGAVAFYPGLHQRMVQARDRAKRKLMDSLTKDQQRTTHLYGYFDVQGNATGRVYRIYTDGGTTNNIRATWSGAIHEKRTWCIHLTDVSCPSEDHFLAQALMIKTNERGFLKTAR